MREYSRRQLDDFHDLEKRRSIAYEAIPELALLDAGTGETALAALVRPR